MDKSKRPKALFFDLNETLLNLSETKASVSKSLGGNPGLAALWFPTLLHLTLVSTVSGNFMLFEEIAVAALVMVAKGNGIDLSEEKAREAIEPIFSAPPHPDVIPALKRLKEENFPIGVLTNSTRNVMEKQLRTGGMIELFDILLSVKDAGIYKPHREIYEWAAIRKGLRPEACMMIAAHGWDVGGAAWAGMRSAFVARPGQVLYPLAPIPEIIEPDLGKVADRLIEMG